LYDILLDPNEFTNQINNPAYAATRDSMRNLFTGGWQNALPPVYRKRTFYRDSDADGFGTRTDSVIQYFAPSGYVAKVGDCDDTKSFVYPGANERPCNGIDDNCNGVIDENKTLPTVTASGSLDICATGFVTLTASGGSGATYQWKRNGVNITNAVKKNYRAKTAGSYTVVVTNPSSGCVAESLPTVVTNSCGKIALDDAYASDAVTPGINFSLYPNPSKGNVAVRYAGPTAGTLVVKIYDAAGRVVYSKKEQVLKAANVFNLNLSSLVSGVYYMELNDNNVKQRLKFIIER
jgi:hypothetical protein